MKKCLSILCLVWLCILTGGCGSNPAKTQRPDLLDDKVTAGRVDGALRRAGPRFDRVSVRASNGQVTLTGEVATSGDKSRAEELARGVKRVQQLEDQLQVKPVQ